MDSRELVFQFIHSPSTIEALCILIDKRVEELKEALSTADIDRVKGIQKAIEELRKFKSIKDTITKEVKNGK